MTRADMFGFKGSTSWSLLALVCSVHAARMATPAAWAHRQSQVGLDANHNAEQHGMHSTAGHDGVRKDDMRSSSSASQLQHADPDFLREPPTPAARRLACLRYLKQHMPQSDIGRITTPQLAQNVELALKARGTYPWGVHVPWPLFLNDVLPYASLDEPRDDWRTLFVRALPPLVQHAHTVGEAAQALNMAVWGLWGIVFKPDHTPEIMSPTQVIRAGYASCTGLSIFLVAACRAMGIPARVAGIPSWIDSPQAAADARVVAAGSKRVLQARSQRSWDNHDWNNHDWVEVWDGTAWSWVGAAEWDPRGMNRTWFFPQPAKRSIPGDRIHAIYAASWAPTPDNTTFPLVWNEDWVQPGVDRTQVYLDAEVLD